MSNLLPFFQSMAQAYLDPYLVTLMAVEQISGKLVIVKRKNLLREMHACLKALY